MSESNDARPRGDLNDRGGGNERWYLVDTIHNTVHYGPATETECQQIAAGVEVDVEVEFAVIDRNGLVGFERCGDVEWTYAKNATHPDEVDGGLMGELLDAAFSGSDDDLLTDEIKHLVCSACNDGPRVARFGDVAKLVCHCTHVDGDLDPVTINEMAILPDPWSYETNGQADSAGVSDQ